MRSSVVVVELFDISRLFVTSPPNHNARRHVIRVCVRLFVARYPRSVKTKLHYSVYFRLVVDLLVTLSDDVTSAESLTTFRQRLKTHLFTKSFF